MAKKNIKMVLKTKKNITSYEGIGLVNGKQIQFFWDSFKMTVDIGQNSVTIKRRNEEYEILLYFEQGNSFGKVSFLQREMDLPIILKQFKIEKKELFILYQLEKEDYEFSLYY